MSTDPIATGSESLIRDQAAGVVVQIVNEIRIQDEIVKLATQDAAFDLAVSQLDKVRDFLSEPGNILGSAATKHGEIAEQVEVGLRNAWQAIFQENMTATFDGVGRLDAVDYIINGVAVQSKFINGIGNNLRHVLMHLGKYPNFVSMGYYMIPKDTYEAILILVNGGHIEGLKGTTEEAILVLVKEIEAKTGKTFTEAVQSSVVTYHDVQIVTAPTTLNGQEQALGTQNETLKQEIRLEHEPSWREAGQAAFIGAAVTGTLSFATGVYAKYKDGKNIFKGDFTAEDWKEIGIETGVGAAGGAVAAGSIYLMTNYAGMAAPFASAVVTAAKGLGSLSRDYHRGAISFEEFFDLGMIVCAESAIVGVSTIVGQSVIPVPVLGAIIGSLAGRMIVELVPDKSDRTTQRLRAEMAAFKAKLDNALQAVLEQIIAEIDRLESLTIAAFDFRLNTSLLDRSVTLALAYGVKEDKIITNEMSLDKFMLI